jgi:hypothetical protein
MILLDSDHVSVLAHMRHSLHEPFVQRLTSVSEPVAVPVVACRRMCRTVSRKDFPCSTPYRPMSKI